MRGRDHQALPSPAQTTSSTPITDISSFTTPQKPTGIHFQSPRTEFFTASRQTPTSSPSSSFVRRRSSVAPSAVSSRTARRFKEFELEQSRSCRKAQVKKESSLRCLSKSLTAWLNFLFENPKLCGCNESAPDVIEKDISRRSNGKRDIHPGSGVEVCLDWQSPKRHRDCLWPPEEHSSPDFPNSTFSSLDDSFNWVCSFEDLKQRMNMYLGLGNCKEIFKVMSQIAKGIDEGRLRMKAHCPIVTDVGVKEKSIRLLMSYNPIWLRAGLYIILGGDSLLPDGDADSVEERAFLKMVIDKQFFSHAGLAKAYAYNKSVEGMYRPGYFEILGNVVLKRFLLLALVLDRAKCISTLPMEDGIDGVDGGSPLLFTLQSCVKSSDQMISDFLSTSVMHGEGNLLVHLSILGYRVSYKQCALHEYDFRVKNLFEDMQDGVRLCRAFQLLKRDNSIMAKIVLPSDTRKRNIMNCTNALQHLKQADVPLHDDEGAIIGTDDIVSGDRELIISLLWNIFVHLQLPLLISKQLVLEEIHKIHGDEEDISKADNSTYLEMILSWIQAICKNYDGIEVPNFSSLVDGKAMLCLLDFYFQKDTLNGEGKVSLVSDSGHEDVLHNMMLSQKLLSTILGSFPEIGDLLEQKSGCDHHSVVILLAFLLSQLVVRKKKDQLNFHKFLERTCRKRCSIETSTQEEGFEVVPEMSRELRPSHAAAVIQAQYRCWAERRRYLKLKGSVSKLKTSMHTWCVVKRSTSVHASELWMEGRWKNAQQRRHAAVILDRHRFVESRRAVVLIQRIFRSWASRRRAAVKIQSSFRRLMSVNELRRKRAAVKIQSSFRRLMSVNELRRKRAAATLIQSHARACSGRRRLGLHRSALLVQRHWRGLAGRRRASAAAAAAAAEIRCGDVVKEEEESLKRLLASVEELASMKSASSVLQTCAAVDKVTRCSEKWCAELVGAGAVHVLLQEMGAVSRSVPDRQITKHVLSSLANISRYSHLLDSLIETPHCVEIVFCQMLRNKCELFFVASEILKRMCSKQKGVCALTGSTLFLKRLQHLIVKLSYKSLIEKKRCAQRGGVQTAAQRRLGEAQALINLLGVE